MPSRIPVRIAEHLFPSLNQARIHYRDILHRYPPGEKLQEEDRLQVMDLMAGSGAALPPSGSSHVVRVVLGHYGRPCFVSNSGGESPQVISITRSIKQCVPSSDFCRRRRLPPRPRFRREHIDASAGGWSAQWPLDMRPLPVTSRNCCIQTNGGLAACPVLHLPTSN